MDYWNEVKRIQIKLKSALNTGTQQATEIIDGITGKLGYFFNLNNVIYHSDSRDRILSALAETEKKGEQPELVKERKEHYQTQNEYVAAEELTDDEMVQKASILEQVVRQLEAEVDEYIQAAART
jgi:hypothetical protein